MPITPAHRRSKENNKKIIDQHRKNKGKFCFFGGVSQYPDHAPFQIRLSRHGQIEYDNRKGSGRPMVPKYRRIFNTSGFDVDEYDIVDC